jgi:uncharacterized protein
MIAVISPAKTLDFASVLPPCASTRPRFAAEADRLAQAAAKLSAPRLAALMRISPTLAKLNVERFRGWADAPERPAIHAFAGDVYTGFDVRSLDDEAHAYARGHLRIFSGLYGLLRPHDTIRPYRLEMGTRWAPGRAKDLYAFWGSRVAALLADDAEAEGSRTVVNLSSQEYWGAVAGKLPSALTVVDIDFREDGPDGPRFVSFNAKRARGMMARWICEHRVEDVDALAGFDSDGYRFAGREGATLRFVRR